MNVLSKARRAISWCTEHAGVCAIALIVLSLAFAFPNATRLLRERQSPPSETRVQAVIDGDTIEMQGGARVRFIGINTPEVGQPMSSEATAFLKELLKGRDVTLEKDVTDRDRYGRLLRYVWTGDTLVNAEMVRAGYAQPYDIPPDSKYQGLMLVAEQEARSLRKGLWERSSAAGIIVVETILADAPGDDRKNLNGEYVALKNTGSGAIEMAGWMLNAGGTQSFMFPTFAMEARSTIAIYSGTGTNTKTALYWNREKNTTPIWNNKGGVILLRDRSGKIVLDQIYKPSSSVVQ